MVTDIEEPNVELDPLPTEELDEAVARQERARSARMDRRFPKPTEGDITAIKRRLENEFRLYHEGTPDRHGTNTERPAWGMPGIDGVREIRFGQDGLTEEVKDRLHNESLHIRTGYTHREITNVVSSIMQNRPVVTVAKSGPTAEDEDIAIRQEVFCSAVLEAFEDYARQPLWWRAVDNLAEDSLGAFELYETPERFEVDPEDEIDVFRRAMPLGVRTVDPRSLYYDFDDPSNPIVVICERKARRHLYERREARLSSTDAKEAAERPKPWTDGSPSEASEYGYNIEGEDEVETIRYYDRRWFCYMVGSELVTCEEHPFTDVPVVIGWGPINGSSKTSERHIGITSSSANLERALNEFSTVTLDQKIAFNGPKMAIEQDKDAPSDADGVTNVDLSSEGVDSVPQLPPGARVVNMAREMMTPTDPYMFGFLQGQLGQGQMNPVATGQSPGADPAGFAINALQQGAQLPYGALYENYANMLARLLNLVRSYIKHNDELFSLQVNRDDDHVEWLDLTADDITDVPVKVTIDEIGPQQRAAVAAYYRDGVQAGLVGEPEAMQKGYGQRDWRVTKRQIQKDQLWKMLTPVVLQEIVRRAMPEVYAMQMGGQPQEGGGAPQGEADATAQTTGAVPADQERPGIGRTPGYDAGGDQSGARNPSAQRAGQQPQEQV